MTSKTKLFAFALAAMAFTTTTAFAVDNGLPEPVEHPPVERGHGPVKLPPVVRGHGPVTSPGPVGGPIKSPPHPIAQPLTAPPAGLREGGIVKAAPAPATCPAGSISIGAGRCVESPGLPPVLGGGGGGGGGGFGTVLPGGGNTDRCFEEFRCQESVD
jgi:hypothetical protein